MTEGGASGRTEDFYKKARILWRLLTRGVKRDGLDSYLRRELSKFPVPEVVTRSTASALLLIYTSSVHDVIVRTLRMDRKRQFLERVLLHALSDETIPAWSQIKERVEEEAESALNQQSLGPGRPPVIDDLNTYPEVVLRALLEWTDNPANLKKPFRSLNPDNTNTLCGYIRKRLKKHTEQETGHGYAPSQDTIKSQLRSLMGSLGIDLPYGPTNKRSYFEAREEIKDAMEDRFRALP